MIENLNKENFWNDLHKQYPEAVDHFCKWIDEYKKEVNWDELFKVDYKVNTEGGMFKVKFHDLPFEMQSGILTRYELELLRGKEMYWRSSNDHKQRIEKLFAYSQKDLL